MPKERQQADELKKYGAEIIELSNRITELETRRTLLLELNDNLHKFIDEKMDERFTLEKRMHEWRSLAIWAWVALGINLVWTLFLQFATK